MDPVVEQSISQYSVFTLAACVIASVYLGPLVIVIWVVATLLLVWYGRDLSGRRPPR